MYTIVLEKSVQKFLEKHKWEWWINNFKKALQILVVDPYENNLDIKMIIWLPNVYWLRIGKYRFLYEILDNNIIITFLKAGKRGDVYK